MKKCVETGPVTPMQKEWAQKIVQMIPEKLRSTPYMKEFINDLFEEIKTDFTSSMKKSMGEYGMKYSASSEATVKSLIIEVVYFSCVLH